MRAFLALSIAAALVAASFVTAVSVLAEEKAPAPAAPAPQKKIDHPFLTALVGDWAVTTTRQGSEGPVSAAGKSRIALGVRDTALLQDYDTSAMGGYGGHGVAKVSDDGKTLRLWWYDSFGADPVLLEGPLTDTSAEITGTCPQGTIRILWKKVNGGFDFEMTMNDKPGFTDTYRKGS